MFCHTLIYIVIIYILIPKVNTNKKIYSFFTLCTTSCNNFYIFKQIA